MTDPGKQVGRPSKLTPEVQQIICEGSSRGVYDHVVARAAGISPSTFYTWMRAGEAEERRIDAGGDPDDAQSVFLEFSQSVNRARAMARGVAEARVWETNPETWLLKGPGRDRPGEEGWASAVKHEHTGADGGPMEVVSRAARDLTSRMDRLAAAKRAHEADDGAGADGG